MVALLYALQAAGEMRPISYLVEVQGKTVLDYDLDARWKSQLYSCRMTRRHTV